jgi:dolichyl-phosphate beta-glucosyltransferase
MQTGDSNYCEVSIIIPVYNGSKLLEKHLTPFLTWLDSRPYSTQVILVDDGSPDHSLTAAYARKYGLIFHGFPVNKGKGAALRKGFSLAGGSIRLFTDADIPFQYRNIDDLVTPLRKAPEQLIIGDRTAPDSDYFDKASYLRNWGSNLVSALVNLFFARDIKDTQCGLKGMGKNVALQLFGDSHIDRFAIDIELIYLARINNIPILRIPVQLRYNDKSSIKVAKDGLRLLWDIYRIKKIHPSHSNPTS